MPVEVRLAARVAPLVPLVDGQRDRRVEHRGHHVDERHLGHDRPPAVRALAEHRALEQPAGAQAARWRSATRRPGPGEPVGDRDVVVERVLLVLEPPVQPPAPAALAAAADVRVHPDDAPVEQARQRRVPLRLVHRLVGAVPVEQGGRGAVERGVAVPDHGRRRPACRPARRTSRRSVTYARRVVARRLAGGARPATRAGRQVDVGPDRRVRCRRGRRPSRPPRRTPCCGPGATAPPGNRLRMHPPLAGQVVVRRRPAAGARRPRAGSITTCAGERVDPLQPLGGVLGAAPRSRRCGPGRRRAARDTVISRNSTASSLVDQQQVAAGVAAHVLGPVDDPRPAAADRPRRRLGRVGVDGPDLAGVAALAEHQRRRRRTGVARTLRSNRSSGSSSTSTSSATGVPIRCRHTWCGRYASSWTV